MREHLRHDLSVLEKGYLISYEGEEDILQDHQDIISCRTYYSGFSQVDKKSPHRCYTMGGPKTIIMQQG